MQALLDKFILVGLNFGTSEHFNQTQIMFLKILATL